MKKRYFILSMTFQGDVSEYGTIPEVANERSEAKLKPELERGGWLVAPGVESFDGRWELSCCSAGRTGYPLPLYPALWGEMGGADRETGRKPLWGSIVL